MLRPHGNSGLTGFSNVVISPTGDICGVFDVTGTGFGGTIVEVDTAAVALGIATRGGSEFRPKFFSGVVQPIAETSRQQPRNRNPCVMFRPMKKSNGPHIHA